MNPPTQTKIEGQEEVQTSSDRKLLEYVRSHNGLHRIQYERILNYFEMFRDHPKHKYHKQLLTMGKNFMDRCPEEVLQELFNSTIGNYRLFLNQQKQKDYDKFERANHIYEQWAEQNAHKKAPDPMEQFMRGQREQERR